MQSKFTASQIPEIYGKIRRQKKTQNIHVIGGLELDEERVGSSCGWGTCKVTPMEYKILLLLMKNPGRVFSADEIYERVWNERSQHRHDHGACTEYS